MRDIKFRAWTGIKMEYNVMVGFLGAFYVQGIDPKDTASMSPFNTHYDKIVPVMQFTGLHDKNGKEIYEGDIIDEIWENDTPYKHLVNGYYSVARAIVEFEAPEFILREVNKDCKIEMYFDKNKKFKVIGNIYENPELLKGGDIVK